MGPYEWVRRSGDDGLRSDTCRSDGDHRQPHEHVRAKNERNPETQASPELTVTHATSAHGIAGRGKRRGRPHLLEPLIEAPLEHAVDMVRH